MIPIVKTVLVCLMLTAMSLGCSTSTSDRGDGTYTIVSGANPEKIVGHAPRTPAYLMKNLGLFGYWEVVNENIEWFPWAQQEITSVMQSCPVCEAVPVDFYDNLDDRGPVYSNDNGAYVGWHHVPAMVLTRVPHPEYSYYYESYLTMTNASGSLEVPTTKIGIVFYFAPDLVY